MSATEEDTELRDLLIQNLENNGVLNKIKAELRAAVFLALEEQDKVENKTPLVNENLRKCLSTKDGNLITDFLQVFNLDFTLAVFQPEINTVNGLDTRESLSKELGFSECEANKSTPLLLEFIKRSRNNDKFSIFSEADRASHISKELSPRQIAEAQKKFDCRCKDPSGGLGKDDNIGIFSELVPNFSSLSAIGSDTEGDGEDMFSDAENKASTNPEPRRLGSTKAPGITSSHLSDTPPLKSAENNQKDSVSSKTESKEKSLPDVKMLKEKTGSVLPADEELDYDDDFNSHNSKSEVSISEEIEEASLEGPDLSDRNKSENPITKTRIDDFSSLQLEEITQDVSVSQTSQAADYMEDVDGQANNT
ncbi:FGFR1 oncogene partner isoform X8 [Silurus asotus]|uniref:FGFR1 oncogene partner isoform X8 n=1 Tax=Silurus asotus TaxID=30991 RepID=A0AAD5A777_SILAS|nr:FGFR1 oncogene partner isoform X8 [Silurus asotus]